MFKAWDSSTQILVTDLKVDNSGIKQRDSINTKWQSFFGDIHETSMNLLSTIFSGGSTSLYINLQSNYFVLWYLINFVLIDGQIEYVGPSQSYSWPTICSKHSCTRD